MKIRKCPICKGRGKVTANFYFMPEAQGPQPCRACHGFGFHQSTGFPGFEGPQPASTPSTGVSSSDLAGITAHVCTSLFQSLDKAQRAGKVEA